MHIQKRTNEGYGNNGVFNIGNYNRGNGNIGNNNNGSGNVGDNNVGDFNYGTSITGTGTTIIGTKTIVNPPPPVTRDSNGQPIFTAYPTIPVISATITGTVQPSATFTIPIGSRTATATGAATSTSSSSPTVVPPQTSSPDSNDQTKTILLATLLPLLLLLLLLGAFLVYKRNKNKKLTEDQRKDERLAIPPVAPTVLTRSQSPVRPKEVSPTLPSIPSPQALESPYSANYSLNTPPSEYAMAGAAAVGVGAAALASAGSSKEKQLPYGSDVQYGVIGGGSALVAGQVEESKTVVSVSDMDIPEDSVVPEETQKLRQMASLSSMAPSDQVLQEEILTRKIITATTKTTTTEKVVGVAAGAVAVGAAASSVGSKKGYTVITNQSLDEEEEDLSSYHPPAPTSHVVTTSYFPIRSDEMLLQTGDLIGIEKEYSDGWARGQNISQGRKRCIFPMAVVTPIKSGPSQTVVRGNRWQGQSTPETNPLASTKIPQRTTSIRRRIKKKTSTATISTSASD